LILQREDPDVQVVRAFQENRDRKSFDMLYNKYKDGIYNYCCRFFNDEDDAADCTQEIFIRIFRNIGSFKFKSQFSTWLYRVAVNNCYSYAKAKKSRLMARSDEMIERIQEPSPDPSTELSMKEAGEAFQRALAKLKEVQRSLIILRDLEGKSYEEIAKIRHMNPGTVRSTLARARYKMAEQLNIYRNGM
jgi:RNA polymerase sigma-70 factor (ECF subfamily)